MLRVIGITDAPEYIIKRIPRPERDEHIAKVHIYDHNRIISVHKAPAPRLTGEEVVADVAWESMTVFAHVYHRELAGSIYSLLPRRSSGGQEYSFAPLPEPIHRNMLVHNQNTIMDLSTRLQSALGEI